MPCRHHPLGADNARRVKNSDGSVSLRCAECARAAERAYRQKRRHEQGLPPARPYHRRDHGKPEPRTPRRIKLECNQGHPLSGSNVKIVRNSDGTSKRRCVTCERASNREYQRRQRAKSPRAPVKSFADILAQSTRMEGDCQLWTAKLDKGHPTLCRHKRYTRVRKILYVARYGSLKHRSDTAVTCGNVLCVNEAHIAGMQRELRAHKARIGERIMQCWDEILRYAHRHSGKLCDADNIALGAVAATYERLLSSEPQIENLIGFLRTAIRNAIVDQARRIKLAPMNTLTDDYDSIASPADTTDPLLICEKDETDKYQRQHYAQVMRRVAYRSKRAASVLRLKRKGLSYAQIGDKLGIAKHTIERHMNVARRIALPRHHSERAPMNRLRQ